MRSSKLDTLEETRGWGAKQSQLLVRGRHGERRDSVRRRTKAPGGNGMWQKEGQLPQDGMRWGEEARGGQAQTSEGTEGLKKGFGLSPEHSQTMGRFSAVE